MRVIRTIIFLLVCLGLIWLVVILFRQVFTSGNQTTPVATSKLSSYARVGTSAQLFLDGPVVANQDHRSVRISVDSSQSKIEVISGYDGSVLQQEAFPNTQESYSVFLRSLDTLGFSKVNTKTIQDERGQCPLQSRYVYLLTDGSKQVIRSWSTSCGTGSMGGVRSSVRSLFIRQIPPKTFASMTNNLAL